MLLSLSVTKAIQRPNEIGFNAKVNAEEKLEIS
jgi:hypothetical protein